MRTYLIARTGEKLVSEILEGSSWINRDSDKHEYYDIEYKGIKIDVKTTTVRFKVYRLGEMIKDYFNFTSGGRNKEERITIFLGIDFENEQYIYRFWLDDKNRSYAKLTEEAITSLELKNIFP